MVADAKVSLIAQERVDSDLQADSRLTMICDATPVPTESLDCIQSRCFRFFVNSKRLPELGDFTFWRLNPKWIRFIGGFGRIHWVSAETYLAQTSSLGNYAEVIVDDLNSRQ
jgi:putative heme iron utilization protein